MKKTMLMMIMVFAMCLVGCGSVETSNEEENRKTESVLETIQNEEAAEMPTENEEMSSEERSEKMLTMIENLQFEEEKERAISDALVDDDTVVYQYNYTTMVQNPLDIDLVYLSLEGVCRDEEGNVKEWFMGSDVVVDNNNWKAGEERKRYAIMFSEKTLKDFEVTAVYIQKTENDEIYKVNLKE